MCASVCTAPYIICIPIYLWFKKRSWKSRASTCRAMEDGDCFVVVCVCDTLTRLHVVLRSQQNKTTVHSLLSFVFLATLIRSALLMPFFPTLPLLPPPPPPTFIFFPPLANSQLSFLLCLLCLRSLIRKINDFVKCRSAAGISCEMRRNTCM